MKSIHLRLYNTIRKILSKKHKGIRVIQHMDLSYCSINFRFINVTFINVIFCSSDLSGLSFVNCKFIDCSFQGTDLRNVKFKTCEFTGANFSHALLMSGKLQDLQFKSCNFKGTNFDNAILDYIIFIDCYSICPTRMLLAYWGMLSSSLTKELMRYDAENHPNKERFRHWVKDHSCPYQDCAIGRVALFSENSTIYQHAKKNTRALPAYELMLRCFKEHNIKLEGNLH